MCLVGEEATDRGQLSVKEEKQVNELKAAQTWDSQRFTSSYGLITAKLECDGTIRYVSTI